MVLVLVPIPVVLVVLLPKFSVVLVLLPEHHGGGDGAGVSRDNTESSTLRREHLIMI